MTAMLHKQGYAVNEKRVRRLLRLMGLEAVYPKVNLSKVSHEHKIYPYLLRNMDIQRNNQVWSTDITYIRLQQGFVYLMAVIDWYNRYVLDWSLSTTLDADFCINTVGGLIENNQCEIFNTDQGSQFTTPRLQAKDGLGAYFEFYNNERLHQSLDYATPSEIYVA